MYVRVVECCVRCVRFAILILHTLQHQHRYEISKNISKCDELIQLLNRIVRIDRTVDVRFIKMTAMLMGSLNRWLGTNAKDLLCNTLLVWILQQLKQPSKLAVVEYVAKTLGSWTCNQTCLDALCQTRARDIVPVRGCSYYFFSAVTMLT